MQSRSADAVGEVEAAFITGLPIAELAAHPYLPKSGGDSFDREACERLGLARLRRGHPPGYWLSVAQAAKALGISRQAVYRMQPPLPYEFARNGQRVVRAHHVRQRVNVRTFLADYAHGLGNPLHTSTNATRVPRTSLPVADIVAAYVAGAGITAVADQFGCSPTGVRSALSRAGVTLRPRGGARKAVTDSEVVRLRDDLRLSWADITAITGMTEEGLRNRYKISTGRAPAGARNRSSRRRPDLTAAQLGELNAIVDRRNEIATACPSGQSTVAELAAAHGVSATTIRRWAKSYEQNAADHHS